MSNSISLLILVASLSLMALSQERGGNIHGTIGLADGSRVQGVVVTLRGEKTGEKRVPSAEDGSFRFVGLPHGAYSLTFEKSGFKTFSRGDIEIMPLQTYQVTVNMQRGLIEVEITTAGKTPEPVSAQGMQVENLTGTWESSLGLTYEIVQRDSHFYWKVESIDERGEIIIDSGQMYSEWNGSRGNGSAKGSVADRDNRGRPMKIRWSNGVIFTRIYRNSQQAISTNPEEHIKITEEKHPTRAVGPEQINPSPFTMVETIVPPSDIDSAPFDSAVLPNGLTVVSGPKNKLLALERDGQFKPTKYPINGRYFESDRYGRMWYWNCPRGTLYLYDPASTQQKQERDNSNLKFTLKQFIGKTFANGTLAVDPDGSQVFVGWWRGHQGVSAVYRFDTTKKILQKIYEETGFPKKVHALEVTEAGEVYLARSHDILKYKNRTGWVKYKNLPSGHIINHDSLTSDSRGNLYYVSTGSVKGIYMISPRHVEIKTIIPLKQKIEVPSGLTWNKRENYLTAVRKQKGELIKIHDFSSRTAKITVLNNATGLVRPIAIEEGPEGEVFINGDEVGILKVSKSGRVSIFKNEICSFQPPAADFTFRKGLLYYSWAAPGFVSQIVTIPNSETYTIFAKKIGTPAGIDLGSDNTIYYCDFNAKGGVFRLESKGLSTKIISNIPYPLGLVVDGNNHFWVGAAELGANPNPNTMNAVLSTRLLHFDSRGKFIKEVINTNKGQFKDKNYKFTFFDVDDAGENIYLPTKNIIFRFDKNGKTINFLKGNYISLRGAKIFSDGYVYFVDYWASALYRLKM